jgi:serine phosphatase RsbU (regulator of sigma subunit)
MTAPAQEEADRLESYAGDRMSRALYALLELSKSLSSEIDLDDLLAVIVEKASSVVEAERTSIFVYDSALDRLWTIVAQGMGTATIELPMGLGVAGDVARTLKLTNIPDAYQDARFSPESDQRTGFRTLSLLCAPVLDSAGKLLGVIESVNKKTGEVFDARDEALMEALASHVAVAMVRARVTEIFMEKERLDESLKLASEIQMRMLPIGAVDLPSTSPFQIHAAMRPARRVGGDLYDFFWDEARLYFCIGDVSGKGVPAALVMALTKTLFRANAVFEPDPAQIMAAVNARLYEETDPAMFVTALCGFLDLRDGRLLYSNAGHDRALLLSNGAVRPMESKAGLVLGVLPAFHYTVQEENLAPGEAIFLYTDGVTEATNRAEELFGLPRIVEALGRCVEAAPAIIVTTMMDHLDRFVLGAPQADDITMMCIRRR